MLVAERRRDDQVDHELPQHLVAQVAERLLGRRVEVDDAPLVVDRDDAVERGVEDRGLARVALLELELGLAMAAPLLAVGEHAVDDEPEPREVRLEHDVARARAERLDRRLLADRPGEDHERDVGGRPRSRSPAPRREAKPGRLWSLSATSQRPLASASRSAGSDQTRRADTSYPWRRSSCSTSSASSSRVLDQQEAELRRHGLRHSRARLRRRLVEQHPVEPERLHRVDELVEVDRLDEVAVHAEVVALDDVALLARRGQHDDRERPQLVARPDLAQHLEPVDLRQLEVEQHDLRALVRRRCRRSAER